MCHPTCDEAAEERRLCRFGVDVRRLRIERPRERHHLISAYRAQGDVNVSPAWRSSKISWHGDQRGGQRVGADQLLGIERFVDRLVFGRESTRGWIIGAVRYSAKVTRASFGAELRIDFAKSMISGAVSAWCALQ